MALAFVPEGRLAFEFEFAFEFIFEGAGVAGAMVGAGVGELRFTFALLTVLLAAPPHAILKLPTVRIVASAICFIITD